MARILLTSSESYLLTCGIPTNQAENLGTIAAWRCLAPPHARPIGLVSGTVTTIRLAK
jgi:hypothetical protein